MKMTYVRLLVDQFDDCFDFYSKVMKFETTWGSKGDVYASFQAGESTMLSLFKKELMREHIGGGAAVTGEDHKAMLIFEADDVDATYVRLLGKDIACINAPHDMPGWGIRCFHLQDPENNLIEINQKLLKDEWSKDLASHPDAK